jgi:ABC-type multidrug transport system ATPase subunit
VLSARGVSKSYGGPPVIRALDFVLMRGQRMAVVGPNGIGKSTLLGMIAGSFAPDQGEIRYGYEVRLGYFGQDHRFAAAGKTTLLDWLYEAAPAESVSTIRGMLGRMLFSGDDADKSVRALSGGEAARLQLARLMLKRDNLLVLDEPTNHLDLEGRQALLEALRAYDGTLIFVSHDRHFVSSLADRVLALTPNGAEDFAGTYEDYLAKENTDYLDAKSAAPTRLARTSGAGDAAGNPADFASRKAQKREAARVARRVQLLEREIQELEARLAEFNMRFAEPGYFETKPWEDVAAAEKGKAAAQADLERKFEEWQGLSSQLDGQGAAS